MKIMKLVLINLSIFFILLLSIEGATRLYLYLARHNVETTYEGWNRFVAPPNNLGFTPGAALKSKKSYGDEVIYDVTYNIDEAGLRRTIDPNPEGKNRHLLLFGDSYEFGEGLEDHQTLASAIASQSEFRVYNFGNVGTAINYALLKLSYLNNIKLKPEQGFTFYFYRDFQLQRVISSIMSTSERRAHLPAYILENGVLKYKGTWMEYRPLLTKMFSCCLKKSKFLQLIKFDWPRPDEQTVELNLSLIKEFHQNLMLKFPATQFVLVIPSNSYYKNKFMDYMQRENINVLILDMLKWNKQGIHPRDAHPNHEDNQRLAEILLQELKGFDNLGPKVPTSKSR
ncbi:MAG: hypothetical protein Fur0010_20160 [Bdellovibrio sp.]